MSSDALVHALQTANLALGPKEIAKRNAAACPVNNVEDMLQWLIASLVRCPDDTYNDSADLAAVALACASCAPFSLATEAYQIQLQTVLEVGSATSGSSRGSPQRNGRRQARNPAVIARKPASAAGHCGHNVRAHCSMYLGDPQ